MDTRDQERWQDPLQGKEGEEKRKNGEKYGQSKDERKEKISERSSRRQWHVILRKELNFYIFC